ncbi:hypothetical protein C2G38_2163830 [Gigaspora rosea]|uniref:Uncharacterized protein n=1 Tax=Gigaspora rosea TaxID=44941 RepID=A0A397W4D4_9GLOM|nr:hypothetical protein C2G38_2163830 [Gigaspora rosea]
MHLRHIMFNKIFNNDATGRNPKFLAETVQKISALEAKYKNPSGLSIISKPKVSKDKKQTKISLSKVFSLNKTEISEVKKMAGIILDNYRILHDTTISRVKPTLVNNWIDMALMKDEKKKQKVQEKMPNVKFQIETIRMLKKL